MRFSYSFTEHESSTSSSTCVSFWDPVEASVNPTCVPWISLLPAITAVVILMVYGVDYVFPKSPLWLSRFATEGHKYVNEFEPTGKRWTHWTLSLMVSSTLGLAMSVAYVLIALEVSIAALIVFPWATATLVVAVQKPRSTPFLLLVLFCTILIYRSATTSTSSFRAQVPFTLAAAELCLALIAVVVILVMPLRNPDLGIGDVSTPFSTPSYHLRSPEDNMSLWQFMSVSWMAPLIAIGKKRQLNDEDVWLLPYEFQHSRLHYLFREIKGSVLMRLLQANSIDLLITSFLGLLESVAKFSVPVLLQQLLQSIEDSSTTKKPAITYATLILVIRLVTAQSGIFSLWFCRRCYERSRGEMITMVFEKALSRKAFGSEAPTDDDMLGNTPVNGTASLRKEDVHGANRFWKYLASTTHALRLDKLKSLFSSNSKSEKQSSRASMGKILNLLRNDVYEVAQRFWEFQNIITKPLALIFSVTLVWKLLGWPCLLGVSTVIFAQLLNALFIRALLRLERVRRIATDTRLQVSSQFVEAIRHLRWYDWQKSWMNKILDARQKELSLRIITGLWNMAISTTNSLAGGLFPVVAFAAYTLLAGQPLRVDVAFPALQLFSMLDASLRELPDLIRVLLNANVALGRIEDFMSEPNREEHLSSKSPAGAEVSFKDASFAWPSVSQNVLEDVTLSFTTGLSLITGRVGQGKSALLQAVLGELDRRGGHVDHPNEIIGYCSQSPWLQSMSIRDNILFSAPYDPERYRQVLNTCALIPDLASFKHGDLSNIGENGIGLSGGQKARVALARAIYSRSRILLLDDPLAALDHDTATTIVQRLFNGPLTRGRTVILVTHRVDLCVHLAYQVLDVHEGRVSKIEKDSLISDQREHGRDEFQEASEETLIKQSEDEANAVPEKFIEEEHRAHGGVMASVYWQYVKAGGLRFWTLLILANVLFRLIRLLNYWFLKAWGEAYNGAVESSALKFFDRLPPPETNVRPWLIGYLVIAILLAIAFAFVEGTMLIIIYVAGRNLFKDVLDRVTGATFRFYDTTPVGRLMNRLTSDFGTLDGGISHQLSAVVWCSISWLSAVVIIASTTPLFLVFTVALSATFIWIFMWFLPTSQSLRRLEMVSLSPLLSNFGTLLEGLTTVRAFRAQTHFQDRVITVTDAFQKMDHFYWSLQAWLMFRLDVLSALSTFLLTLLALYDNLSQGLTAFILTTAANFVTNTHLLCRLYGQLQMDFVSVERVIELLELDQEPGGTVDPPASWPSSKDEIVFDNATVKYAPHLDPALSSVSFRIPGGSTTAVIGRTGSGKSTLALTLLATMLPEPDGQVTIGSVDLSKVNVHILRQRITFVAQDPVLFPGTLRQNIDPNEAFSDAECLSVINRIFSTAASDSSSNTPSFNLDTVIETGGKNLSQGQRQLVGLGRAALRRSPIVILDEATASIDVQTAHEVQRVLREELSQSTVIMIAHRIEAVRQAGWAVVLDKKKVVASGPAQDIIEKQFRGLEDVENDEPEAESRART